jgi:regulation of enolase protein 1 (concanavalin A-like superfamily)
MKKIGKSPEQNFQDRLELSWGQNVTLKAPEHGDFWDKLILIYYGFLRSFSKKNPFAYRKDQEKFKQEYKLRKAPTGFTRHF